MKKVSVIVPVYNVEKHVGNCLEKLVNQTIDDIEILVVNDGSTDNSQAVIDEYAAKYPDKIKAFESENRGAAGARNYALEHATGEYIGFVDSDDFAEVDMFEKLYNKAKSDDADIVSCGYYRIVNGVGKKRACYDYPCFGENVFDEPSLFINNLPYIWNKIFKRELVLKIGGFDNRLRIYEDLVFTYKLFLLANKIDLVPEPLYCYTINREESLTSTFSEKRFDIFTAADDLIAFFKENSAFEFFEDELLFVILKHIYVVLEKEVVFSSIPIKNKFINQAFRYLNTTFPWWRDYGLYYKRFKKNKKKYTKKLWWKSFFVVKKAPRKAVKRAIKGSVTALKLFAGSNLGGVFNKYSKKPLDEKAVILQAQHGNNLSGNIFYLLRELSSDKYSDYKLYVPYNKSKFKAYQSLINAYGFNRAELVDINSSRYARLLATSKYLFNDTSFASYFIKREGQVYLNTWHGTPLKTLGKSSITDFYDIANLQKNFVSADYLLYPNEYTRDNMMRDYMLPDIFRGEVLLSGYPRNEIFFDEKRRDELKEKFELGDMQVLAYMPTWRGNVRDVDHESQIEEIREYLKYIDDNLGDNQVLYVNFHPFVMADLSLKGFSKIKKFPAKYETYDFLNVADVLITDYSSVMFDYSLTGGKVILFTYDREDYLGTRGLYLDFDKLPFSRVDTVNELVAEINKAEKPDVSGLLDEYCSYDRADISAQICSMMLKGESTELSLTQNTSDKSCVFLFAGDALSKSNRTDRFLAAVGDAEDSEKYSYYVSYVTEKVRRDTEELYKISGKINFMGQLKVFTNTSKLTRFNIAVLMRFKPLYSVMRSSLRKAFKTEFKRVFADIEMCALLGYGNIETARLYTLAEAECKKFLYLEKPSELNRRVHASVYKKFDAILVNDDKTAKAVKAYCKGANVKKCADFSSVRLIESEL